MAIERLVTSLCTPVSLDSKYKTSHITLEQALDYFPYTTSIVGTYCWSNIFAFQISYFNMENTC